MTSISDDMLDRHAARGVIVADQFRRGDGYDTERKAITDIISQSAAMSKTDGITDKGVAGFLAMAALGHFFMRLHDGAGGAA
jgi:hypothetical protein